MDTIKSTNFSKTADIYSGPKTEGNSVRDKRIPEVDIKQAVKSKKPQIAAVLEDTRLHNQADGTSCPENYYLPGLQRIDASLKNDSTLKGLFDFVNKFSQASQGLSLLMPVDKPLIGQQSGLSPENYSASPQTDSTSSASGGKSTENYSGSEKSFNFAFFNAFVVLFNFINNELTPEQIANVGAVSKNILTLMVAASQITEAQAQAIVDYMNDAKTLTNISSWLQFGGAGIYAGMAVAGGVISYKGQGDMINATSNLDFFEMSSKTAAVKPTLNDYRTKVANNYTADEMSNLRTHFSEKDPGAFAEINARTNAVREMNQRVKNETLGDQAIIDLKSDPIAKSAGAFRDIKKEETANGLLTANGERFDDAAVRNVVEGTLQEQNDYLNLPKIKREDIEGLDNFQQLTSRRQQIIQDKMFVVNGNNPTPTDQMNLVTSREENGNRIISFIDCDANNNIYMKQIKPVVQQDGTQTYEFRSVLLGNDAELANTVRMHQNNKIYLSKNIKDVKVIKLYNDNANAANPAYQELQDGIQVQRGGLTEVQQDFATAKQSVVDNQGQIVKYKELYDKKIHQDELNSNDPFGPRDVFTGVDEMALDVLKGNSQDPVFVNAVEVIENPANRDRALHELQFSSDEIPYAITSDSGIVKQGIPFKFNGNGQVKFDQRVDELPIVVDFNTQINHYEAELNGQRFVQQARISDARMAELDNFTADLLKADAQNNNLNEHLEALSPLQIGDPMRGEKNGQYYEATLAYKKQAEKASHFKTALGMAMAPVGMFIQKFIEFFANQKQMDSQSIQKIGESSTNMSQAYLSATQTLIQTLSQDNNQRNNMVMQAIQEEMSGIVRATSRR